VARSRRKPKHIYRDYAEPSGFRPMRIAHVPAPSRTPVRAPRKAPGRKVSTRPNRFPSRTPVPRKRPRVVPSTLPERRSKTHRRRLGLLALLSDRERHRQFIRERRINNLARLPCIVATRIIGLRKFIAMRKRLGKAFGSNMQERRYTEEKRSINREVHCI